MGSITAPGLLDCFVFSAYHRSFSLDAPWSWGLLSWPRPNIFFESNFFWTKTLPQGQHKSPWTVWTVRLVSAYHRSLSLDAPWSWGLPSWPRPNIFLKANFGWLQINAIKHFWTKTLDLFSPYHRSLSLDAPGSWGLHSWPRPNIFLKANFGWLQINAKIVGPKPFIMGSIKAPGLSGLLDCFQLTIEAFLWMLPDSEASLLGRGQTSSLKANFGWLYKLMQYFWTKTLPHGQHNSPWTVRLFCVFSLP